MAWPMPLLAPVTTALRPSSIRSMFVLPSFRVQLYTVVSRADVIVVGGGNAGFCAAHAAAERGARVLLLEKAPEAEAGGNSFYTAGAFRVAHGGAEALAPLLEPDERLPDTDLEPYTAQDFRADLDRITSGRCDPAMADQLVEESEDLPRWLAEKGLRWRLMYERQAYQRNGRWVFWGGLALGTVDGGK